MHLYHVERQFRLFGPLPPAELEGLTPSDVRMAARGAIDKLDCWAALTLAPARAEELSGRASDLLAEYF